MPLYADSIIEILPRSLFEKLNHSICYKSLAYKVIFIIFRQFTLQQVVRLVK